MVDFSAIFQTRSKKFWWMDVILYFVISLLIATVFCYLVFWIENGMLRKQIDNESLSLQTVGTDLQKNREKEVINYQAKINDFAALLDGHQFASNAFAFMQSQTMPNVWFKQFVFDEKSGGIQLSGETESIDAFSRQVAVLEKNRYVKGLGNVSTALGAASRVSFNISLSMSPDVFGYISDNRLSILETVTPSDESVVEGQTNDNGDTALTDGQKSDEKLITSFHLLLNPEVVGVLDEANYTVTLSVPYGTNLKNLTPSIVFSPEATVFPAPNLAQNFTSPVTYKVIAQNGSIQNYIVTVNVLPEVAKELVKSNGSLLMIIISVAVIIVVALIVFLLFWKKRKVKEIPS